jgi:hypothetical protein
MRLASSWIVIVSGIVTSRAIFSFCSTWRWPMRRWLRRRNDATERVRSSSPEVAAVTVKRPRRRSSPGVLGVFGTATGLAATPGRRMVRGPSSSSVAARAAIGAGRGVAGFAAVVAGSGVGAAAGRAMWFRLGGRRPSGMAREIVLRGSELAGRDGAEARGGAGSSPRRRRASSSARRLRSSSWRRRSSSSRLRASAASRSRASFASRSVRRLASSA